MSYPAYEAFGKEIGPGYATWRVYMALQPPKLDFAVPKDIKTAALAQELRMGRQHVRNAITRLIALGYLIEHGRDTRGVRSLRLAYALSQAA